MDNRLKYIDIGVNLFDRKFRNKEIKILENAADDENVHCVNIMNSIEQIKRYYKLLSKGAYITPSVGIKNTKLKEPQLHLPEMYMLKTLYTTTGIHPHNASSFKIEQITAISSLINNAHVVAIGETGLDYDRMFSSKEDQIFCFEEQIKLAEKFNLPLFLHERKASEDFLNILKCHKELASKSIVHCFTGNINTLDEYLNLGLSIGITTFICDDKRATDLRNAVRIIPIDRLLIETDSPYLRPKNRNGLARYNVPQNIKFVPEELEKYTSYSKEEIRKNALLNTLKIFNIKYDEEFVDI